MEWTPECEQAFQTLKKLSEPPVLIVPNFSKPFVVQTDASNIRISAVLTQKGPDDQEHSVAYASHKLKPREQNYLVVEKVSSHRVGSAVLLPLPLWPTLCSGDRPSAPNLAATNEESEPRLARWAFTVQP